MADIEVRRRLRLVPLRREPTRCDRADFEAFRHSLSKKRVPTCQADLSGEHLATPAVLKGCKLTPKLRRACRRAPARQVPARLAAVGGDERMGLKACSQPAVAVDGRLSMRHRARVPRFECWNGGRKIPAKFVSSKFVSSAKGWIVDARKAGPAARIRCL